jgi:hypothetical protein
VPEPPAPDGDAAPTITDVLVTPLGNFDLSTMFNALADLDPGNAAAGVDDTPGSAPFGGLLDWISGLFSGSGDGGGLFDGGGFADLFGGEDGGSSDFFDPGSLFG